MIRLHRVVVIENETNSTNTKGYREENDSTFTHHGIEYSINKIHEQLENSKAKLQTVKVDDLKWIMKYSKPDTKRVTNANTDTPILFTKENGKYYVIDGLHRLTKAINKGISELTGYLVTQAQLNKAKIKS